MDLVEFVALRRVQKHLLGHVRALLLHGFLGIVVLARPALHLVQVRFDLLLQHLEVLHLLLYPVLILLARCRCRLRPNDRLAPEHYIVQDLLLMQVDSTLVLPAVAGDWPGSSLEYAHVGA